MKCVGLSCKYFYVGERCCQREYDGEYRDGEYPVWGKRWRAHQERADHVRGVAQWVDLRKNHEYDWKLPRLPEVLNQEEWVENAAAEEQRVVDEASGCDEFFEAGGGYGD